MRKAEHDILVYLLGIRRAKEELSNIYLDCAEGRVISHIIEELDAVDYYLCKDINIEN